MKNAFTLAGLVFLAVSQCPAQTAGTQPSQNFVALIIKASTPKSYKAACPIETIEKDIAQAANAEYSVTQSAHTADFTIMADFTILGTKYEVQLDPYYQDNGAALKLSLHNPSQDCTPAADKAVEIIKSILTRSIQDQKAQYQFQYDELNLKIHDLKQSKAETERNLKYLRGGFSDAGLADASIQSVRGMAHELDGQLEMTTVDIAGKSARQKALADAISKLSDEMDAKLASDPVAQQLQVVVDAKQRDLERAKQAYATAAGSTGDIDRIAAELAEAKAAVLERKEAAAKAAGADSLDQWNRDLLSISVDLAELNARSDILNARISKFRNILQTVADYPPEDTLQTKLDAIDSQINALQTQLHDSNQAMNDADLVKITVEKDTQVSAPN